MSDNSVLLLSSTPFINLTYKLLIFNHSLAGNFELNNQWQQYVQSQSFQKNTPFKISANSVFFSQIFFETVVQFTYRKYFLNLFYHTVMRLSRNKKSRKFLPFATHILMNKLYYICQNKSSALKNLIQISVLF